MERVRFSCKHFQRCVKVECTICKEIHGCHYCHDAKWEFAKKKAHIMPWKQVETIVCGRCQKKQPKSNKCINSKCGINFGNYYCEKCSVWTFNKQPIFHCDECNTCHQADRTKVKHCSTCKTCVDKNRYDEHVRKCMKEDLENNCAICQEDLRRGITSATRMTCGHLFHIGCVQEYSVRKVGEMIQGKTLSINCPLCAKSMLRKGEKETEIHLENVKRFLDTFPVFEEKFVSIYCHECEKIFPNQRFHQIGIECPDCKMFNTRVVNYKLNVEEKFGHYINSNDAFQ